MFLPLFVIKKKYSGLVLDNWYNVSGYILLFNRNLALGG